MHTRKPLSDRPRTIKDDSLEIKIVASPFHFREDRENPINQKVVEVVNRMGGVGQDAEEYYQNAIHELAAYGEEALLIVFREYKDLPEDSYLDRWSLIQLLAELRYPSSIEFLDSLLSLAIPEERFKKPHIMSSVGEEVMIRTTAIEALERLASDGSKKALEVLLKHTNHTNFSIKRAATQGFLAHGDENALNVLLETLPEQDRYILDIKRTSVLDVYQAQVEKVTASHDRDDLPPPEPPESTSHVVE